MQEERSAEEQMETVRLSAEQSVEVEMTATVESMDTFVMREGNHTMAGLVEET